MHNFGILYLIPASLGESDINKIITPYNLEIIQSLNEFIVEDDRTARRFLKEIGFTKPLNDIIFHLLNKHTNPHEIYSFLNSITEGNNIGLLSEAGCPCIADPGAEVVKIAHQKNIKVIPLIGASSILLALMASGFNGQNFTFVGYIPIDKNDRINKIKELEKNVYIKKQTQIFIETPYRNKQLLDDLIKTCVDSTLLCIATNITLESEFIQTKTIIEWKKQLPDIHKKTTVFLLYK